MLIRPALPADARDLAVLGTRLWRETYEGLIPSLKLEQYLAETFGPSQQAEELADPACRTLVLAEGSALLGYAWLRAKVPEVEVPFGNPLEVARFYLDQALHGTGAGRSLMQAVLTDAASAGHDGVWLQVWEENPRALRFYAKAGFTEVGKTVFLVGSLSYRDRLLVHRLAAQGD
jgi:ribosomal protein S18 acetylase RimI-like enzyme